MRYLLVVLLLTGCSTLIPTRATFPEVPKEIAEACPDLEKLAPETTKLSEVAGTVTKNYSSYYECQAKQEAWAEWYKAQRKIHEDVK